MKKCSNCKVMQPISSYFKDKYSKDGYKHQCKACCKEYQAKFYKFRIEQAPKHLTLCPEDLYKANKASLESLIPKFLSRPYTEPVKVPTMLDNGFIPCSDGIILKKTDIPIIIIQTPKGTITKDIRLNSPDSLSAFITGHLLEVLEDGKSKIKRPEPPKWKKTRPKDGTEIGGELYKKAPKKEGT